MITLTMRCDMYDIRLNAMYELGIEAYQNGVSDAQCPCVDDDDMDQWMSGWHDAQRAG